ncbi:MAG: SLBB domain-containing protein [Verrucomicrobiota bacterium]
MKIFLAISMLATLPLQAAGKPSNPQSQSEAVVTIGGQVRRPGPVPFHKTLTIYAAIQAAGGPTEFGAMRRVKVIRGGKAEVHDFSDDRAKMILVRRDDTIEIPQKNIFGR